MSPVIAQRLRLARDQVAAAERDLDSVLAAISAAERAEKTMITEALRSALDKLATARTALETADSAS
jgi:hypothetical protein